METSLPEILETGRLVLRRARRYDAPAIFEYASDPEVTRLMDWRTHTVLSEATDFIETSDGRWTHGTDFTWLITIKPDGVPAGAISSSPEGHRATIGYILSRGYWRKGYATEAARRVMECLFEDNTVWRVWATCDVENFASARVLEKVGMTREGKLRRFAVRPNIGPQPRDAFIYARVRE